MRRYGGKRSVVALPIAIALLTSCGFPLGFDYGGGPPDCIYEQSADYRRVEGTYSLSYDGPSGSSPGRRDVHLYVTNQHASGVGLYFCGLDGQIQWDGGIRVSTSYDQGPPTRVVTYDVHEAEVYEAAGFAETADMRGYRRPFVTEHFPRVEMWVRHKHWKEVQHRHLPVTALEGELAQLDPVGGRLQVQFATPEGSDSDVTISFEADIEWDSLYEMRHPEPLTGTWSGEGEQFSVRLQLEEERTAPSTAIIRGSACVAEELEDGSALEACADLSGLNSFKDPYLVLAWVTAVESNTYEYFLQGHFDSEGKFEGNVVSERNGSWEGSREISLEPQ